MGVEVKGRSQLQARFRALADVPEKVAREWQIRTVAGAKQLVRRKTGNTGRTIRPSGLSAREAVVTAGGAAVFLEYGTKAHTIVPRRRKALAWPADGSSATLGGRVRKGGRVRFARRVRHPGTRAYPFLRPAAREAVEHIGAEVIVDAWNRAA